MEQRPPQGSIEDLFLPRLLAELHRQTFEGTLRLSFPDSVKVLYFRKGEIASAASNAEPDRLASILVRDGRLTTEHLDLARSRLQPGTSLGKTLIEMGFLTPAELLQGARRQVSIIVASCFAAATGSYEIVEGPLPAEVTSLGLGTRRLLYDCLMLGGNRSAVVREIGSMETIYRPTDQLEYVLSSLKLDEETDRIGRLLNGTASLRDISGRTSRDDLTVGKVVLALDLFGAAQRVPAPAAEADAQEADAEPVIQIAAGDGGRVIPIVVEPDRPEAASIPPEEPILLEPSIVPEPSIVTVPSAVPREPVPREGPMAAVIEGAIPAEPPAPIEAIAPAGMPVSPLLSMEPSEDEPPPIPDEDLPAFAHAPDASSLPGGDGPGIEQPPQWQIDPVTGDRVHEGPIEMTFDGPINPEAARGRNLARFLLPAGAALLVVAGALGYVVLRRDTNAGAFPPPAAPREAAAEVPAPPAAELPPPAVEAPPHAKTAAVKIPEPVATAPPAPAPTPKMAAAAPIVVRVDPTPAPAQAPRAAPAAPPAAETAVAAARQAPADARFASARRELDGGNPAAAAALFQEWVAAESRTRVTLQLMIACQDDTVKGARARAGADSGLFVLPYSLNGRACYRVCWGLYDDADTARAAVGREVPAAIAGNGAPLVLPLSRLKSGT